ncbi:hypothetical protein D6783_04595 [Candidatus Woesearchaeota archaeon]|nr:MAG: hypothetical protein D6783_04595 [Candidatus Woesearchaeota archaeon]
MQFRRKLYRRGSSTETTIPKPLLFSLNEHEPHDILFIYDPERDRWYIDFQKRQTKTPPATKLPPNQSTRSENDGENYKRKTLREETQKEDRHQKSHPDKLGTKEKKTSKKET